MTDAKPSLARDGTMQVTAKEGIDYLESAGHDKLLKLQGLKPEEDAASGSNKSGLPRDSTMAVTAKEGEQFLEAAGGTVDADALTRSQQKKIEEIQSETSEEPSPKKPKMSKEGTMAVTAKEGKDLLNNEKLGDTRQETKARKGRATPKREGTMAKTMQEAKSLLGDDDLSGGRRTRSRARGAAPPAKPPVKRAGTMQKTAKDGKEFLNRSRKSKKEEEEEEDKESKDEEEEEEEEEEKNE
ncbi:uncharacterized protein [Haliotis cracherodii]|uniref:uncharacterized protein n=1 Tax=Haliotis cracherodii TaxID=6455 RepID=UPI0039E8A645